jgi:hypothetical protein
MVVSRKPSDCYVKRQMLNRSTDQPINRSTDQTIKRSNDAPDERLIFIECRTNERVRHWNCGGGHIAARRSGRIARGVTVRGKRRMRFRSGAPLAPFTVDAEHGSFSHCARRIAIGFDAIPLSVAFMVNYGRRVQAVEQRTTKSCEKRVPRFALRPAAKPRLALIS